MQPSTWVLCPESTCWGWEGDPNTTNHRLHLVLPTPHAAYTINAAMHRPLGREPPSPSDPGAGRWRPSFQHPCVKMAMTASTILHLVTSRYPKPTGLHSQLESETGDVVLFRDGGKRAAWGRPSHSWMLHCALTRAMGILPKPLTRQTPAFPRPLLSPALSEAPVHPVRCQCPHGRALPCHDTSGSKLSMELGSLQSWVCFITCWRKELKHQ